MSWIHEDALSLCKIIESVAPSFGGHVALTGGLLYKDGPRKDCDVLIYRIRQRAEPIDFYGLFDELKIRHGIELLADHGWCKKMRWMGRPFDLFDPESNGEHCS
jgi:hypothetical protein